jgi:hypothetical protein
MKYGGQMSSQSPVQLLRTSSLLLSVMWEWKLHGRRPMKPTPWRMLRLETCLKYINFISVSSADGAYKCKKAAMELRSTI